MGVRPFIERYPDRMFRQLKQWAKSKNTDHRRLASEGCRPRLPWASALNELKKDPAPILPILELLKDDPELYVRRSVANNLNDISNDHPDIVVEIMKRWQGSTKETDWIIKHACRTMLKQGRPDVLSLFGFASPTFIRGSELRFEKKRVRIGGETTFRASIHTSRAKLGKLRLEYVVHFIKSNGQPSPKVFQISEREQSSNSSEVTKRLSLRDLSTRKHFPGIHRVELRVNGVCKGEGSIDVFV
jgi:3-methyladenine DNA glycosylase AlkC